MRSVVSRLERIEQALDRGPCPVCRNQVFIVWHREDEPPPHRVPCSCGQEHILRWVSQSPASLDAALRSNEQVR